MRKFFDRCPAWVFTAILMAAILWLTLAPHPLGDEELPLFPGADKLMHAFMFGALTAVACFDWSRAHGWSNVPWKTALTLACASAVAGIVIEFVQMEMQLGRSMEVADMVADTIGSFIALLLWKWAEKARPRR